MISQAGLRRRYVEARMLAERRVLARVPRKADGRSRILCYHAVGTPAWGVNDLQPAMFRAHLEAALAHGWTFVAASELGGAVTSGDTGGRRLAVTFDDGLASVATHAAPVLHDLGIPFTVFVVSSWADGKHLTHDADLLSWADLERLANDGATIGSHSHTHPDFAALSRQATSDELGTARSMIAERLGITTAEFATPYGQRRNWNPYIAEEAAAVGYRQIYSQSEQTRPVDTIPRSFVTRYDDTRTFLATLDGRFRRWEEFV